MGKRFRLAYYHKESIEKKYTSLATSYMQVEVYILRAIVRMLPVSD